MKKVEAFSLDEEVLTCIKNDDLGKINKSLLVNNILKKHFKRELEGGEKR